jgi:hypothetical protein
MDRASGCQLRPSPATSMMDSTSMTASTDLVALSGPVATSTKENTWRTTATATEKCGGLTAADT